jgi:hypothetical protein
LEEVNNKSLDSVNTVYKHIKINAKLNIRKKGRKPELTERSPLTLILLMWRIG